MWQQEFIWFFTIFHHEALVPFRVIR
jgi:hypothetical protein